MVPTLSSAARWNPFAKISEQRTGKAGILENPDLLCAGEAVKAREDGLLAGMETHFAVMKKTMETRRAVLSKAWTMTDRKERNVAIRKAAADYNIEMRLANKVLKNSRDTIWASYRKSMKACGVKGAPVELEKNVVPNTDLNVQ
ncbi:MAG: hypothetical protein UU85_C0005G0011 [Candidatus Wolfebacteria bacterium GW2011_GWA2_42_10]|uniref:Uncharacterized protein n=2 Tax=Parcubacteria group TaxID=1794811 RepID=A0A0G0ZT94_9BACT|nr:MAG: hypothetical protein UU85_C0005G0011 [Candidatus Wolfebacteria bacterium GW2011_GWA2_42_10]KKT90070.1 MAG: hypothetical protein UW90_C0007G0011 [Candidatus Yanofskybacteria bacterium GW2011_GWB1_45_11]